MTKFIFDDNPNMTVSYLFLQCYNSKNLIFSNGNGEIIKSIEGTGFEGKMKGYLSSLGYSCYFWQKM